MVQMNVMSSESIPEFSVTKSQFYPLTKNKIVPDKKRSTQYSMKIHRKLSKSNSLERSLPLCIKITPSVDNFCFT